MTPLCPKAYTRRKWNELGFTTEAAWCQLPGKGVFKVTREELEKETGTHGFLIFFRLPS